MGMKTGMKSILPFMLAASAMSEGIDMMDYRGHSRSSGGGWLKPTRGNRYWEKKLQRNRLAAKKARQARKISRPKY